MSDLGSRGWSHADPETPLPLCDDHVPTTARLDNHRSNQVARACLKCIALTDEQPEEMRLDLVLEAPQTCRVCGKPAYRDRESNIWYHLTDRSHRVFRGRPMGVA